MDGRDLLNHAISIDVQVGGVVRGQREGGEGPPLIQVDDLHTLKVVEQQISLVVVTG